MALKGFRKPPQSTPEGQALTVATADFARQLEINPLVDGKILACVTVGTSTTNLLHTLGRPFVGWFVVRRTSAADIYENTTQTDSSRFLTLIASSSAVVDIYVF